MQSLRHIDSDKVTFGTYYQSLILSQRDSTSGEPSILQSDKKSNYIPMQDLENIESRRNFEEAKEWQENNGASKGGAIPDQNTAFRRGSQAEDDFDDLFDKHDDSVSKENSDKKIKLSQVLEGSLYIELQKECQHCEAALREEELFSLFA